MELSDALRRRRMVRCFSGRPVERETLDAVLAATRLLPRAGNSDGWDAVVLVGPSEMSQLWESTTSSEWRSTSHRWPGLSRAPVAICLFVSPGAYLSRYDEPDKRRSGLGTVAKGGGGESAWPVPFWFLDAGCVVLALLLSATEAGLGSCFLGNFRGEEELKSALGVPGDRRYVGSVLIGEHGGDDPPSASLSIARRDTSEVLHFSRW